MTEFIKLLNNLIDHSAEILTAAAAFVVAAAAFVGVWFKLEQVRVAAQASADKTDAGNLVIDKIHDVVTAGPAAVVVVNTPENPASVHLA